MPSKSELKLIYAYISGLFDGEGHTVILLSNKGRAYRLEVGITNKDKMTLVWLKSLYGGCIWEKSRYSDNHALAYEWRITKKEEMIRFLNDIRPYVRIKIRQILLALDFLRLPLVRKIGVWPYFRAIPEDIELREDFRNRMNKINARGICQVSQKQ